jgi:hypothetical protein
MTQVRRYPKCKRHFVNNGESLTAQRQKDGWDKAQVVIAALIPIAIGVGSYWIQESISKESVAKDYVGIAITILERPKQEEDNDLREWARKMLVRYSPEPFSPKAQEQLEFGGIGLGQGIIHPNALLGSPNGKKVVMTTTFSFLDALANSTGMLRDLHGHVLLGLIAEVYDLQTGKMISQFEACPDLYNDPRSFGRQTSSKLLIGWSYNGDFYVSLFEVAQGKQLGSYPIKSHGGEIQSAEFSEDGRSVNIKTADGKTEVWQLP